MNKAIITFLAALTLLACADDDNKNTLGPLIPKDSQFGKANEVFTADEWYPGGQLGTTEKASYSAAAPAVEMIEGMEQDFITGEDFFEHMYTHEQEPRKGLGPAWVRNSCIACHPSYGHGKRQTEYRANTIGNGYLLVIYNKDNNSYISEVTGMPQTQAMAPFKAPIDETQIKIEWKTVEQMPSGLSMTFPDGEAYSLIYPEVTIPQTAFNTSPKPTNYEVRLESTIGIYGTGLLDAIDDEEIEKQWKAEAPYVELNPAMWDKAANTFLPSAYYAANYNDTKAFHGTHGPLKRFTYAMTRGTLQDGAGASRINEILSCNNVGKKDIFEKHLLWRQPYNGKEEMSDKQYYQFMVWHRGLAVPAARDLDDEEVKMGKKLFMETGCAQCHRPSWTTGDDNMWVDASIKAYAMNTLGRDANADFTTLLPKYPHQTIWPYTDMVQHRLFMANDIRTGWCRTTPLWGRGLSRQLTGADDRLHDCRARTVIEAIMWHGYSEKSDALPSVKKFHKLSKAERNAVVKFIESI